jgi:Protein of unknown function (DUF968)
MESIPISLQISVQRRRQSARARPGPLTPGVPLLQQKLGAVESAAIRTRLIREVETLPEDDLQPRAISILKAKNRLSADDAKSVEQAFETRMGQQATPLEASATVNATSAAAVATQSDLPSVSPSKVKSAGRRGRPRKTNAPIASVEAPQVPSVSVIKDDPPASTRIQADATPAKIEKSELTIGEPRRHRDKMHLKFVASQPCLVCGRSPADAHHLRFTQPRAMGRKVSDEFTVPLCRSCHRQNHQVGDERSWWKAKTSDPLKVAESLWSISRGVIDRPQ